MEIPFVSFAYTNELIKSDILKSFEAFFDSNYYVLGNKVKEFEKEYAIFNKTKYAVGVSNGLDALHLALKTLDIKEGDEVIVPSNTYIASALAVSYTGAKPVFVEPKIDTYNLDPKLIEQKITKKTKAIMPVHLYGQACEIKDICDIAKSHNLFVVEDNAQSQGAHFDGKLTGSWGDINGTSFYPGKNLGALGDAGAITTNSEELANKTMLYRNYGSSKKYYHEEIGYNMRLDEIQAYFLSVKLKKLNDWNQSRKVIASNYLTQLSDLKELTLPVTHHLAEHVYHLFVVRTKKRDELQAFLQSYGIATMIHYPVAPHMQKAYTHLGYNASDLPIALEIADTCLSLPVWPGLTAEHINYICEKIRLFYKSK
jgi:dTDP-4-amino-4,6-dideoxygalactose transaminase